MAALKEPETVAIVGLKLAARRWALGGEVEPAREALDEAVRVHARCMDRRVRADCLTELATTALEAREKQLDLTTAEADVLAARPR